MGRASVQMCASALTYTEQMAELMYDQDLNRCRNDFIDISGISDSSKYRQFP